MQHAYLKQNQVITMKICAIDFDDINQTDKTIAHVYKDELSFSIVLCV